MNKKQADHIYQRGQDWAEWKERPIEKLGTPASNISMLMEVGVRVESNVIDHTPDYRPEPYNKRTDMIINFRLPDGLRDLAYFIWLGLDGTTDKFNELRMLLAKHDWQLSDIRKKEQELLKAMHEQFEAGAFKSICEY